jgi:hypothetical protein
LASRNFFYRFGVLFAGFGFGPRVNDNWLNFSVGTSELLAYPFLLRLGLTEYIGAWLVIKTAGQWGMWAKRRTAFNRYLVGNILVLAGSLLLLWRFLRP